MITINRLLELKGKHCFYCGVETEISHDPRKNHLAPTRDHIIPKALGGSNKIKNLCVACFRCNNLRGTMDAGRFKESNLLKRRIMFLASGLDVFTASRKVRFSAKREKRRRKKAEKRGISYEEYVTQFCGGLSR